MPRVALVTADQAPLLTRPYFEGGDPGPIAAALATVPELLETALPFVGAALAPAALDARAKELAILRCSALLECRYCIQVRTVVALDLAITDEEIRALRDPTADLAATFGAAEHALLDWVDALAGSGGPVPDEVHAALARHWRDFEVVDLTVTVGATMLLNRFCTALQLETPPETHQRLAEAGLS